MGLSGLLFCVGWVAFVTCDHHMCVGSALFYANAYGFIRGARRNWPGATQPKACVKSRTVDTRGTRKGWYGP